MSKKLEVKMSDLTIPELEFFDSLYQHKRYVFEAGLKIGGIPIERLFNHDASKFWPEEFPHYARQFFGDKGDPDGFALAWLHHIHYNPHHWQHWIFPLTHQPLDSSSTNLMSFSGKVMLMPETYVREMVADWMGANMTYEKTWDMTRWLEKNLQLVRSNLHPRSAACLDSLLNELGYKFDD